jgi:Dockerin type I domain
MRRRVVRSVWLSAALVFLPSGAFGQAFTWGSAANGNWATAGNWTPAGGPPTAGDTATFNLAGTYTVNISSGGNAADAVTVSGPDISFTGLNTFAPSPLLLTTGAADLTVNNGSNLFVGVTRAVAVSVGDTVSVQGSNTTLGLQGGSTLSAALLGVGTVSAPSASYFDVTASTVSATTLSAGLNGGKASINLANNSTFTVTGTSSFASSGIANTVASFTAYGGSTATFGTLNIGSGSGATGQDATVWVNNAGSSITMTGASALTIGSTATPIFASLLVSDAGTFTSGTGSILVRNGAGISVSGGTLNANGNVTLDDGEISVNGSGFFNLAAGKTVTMNNNAKFDHLNAPFFRNGSNLTLTGGSDCFFNGSSFWLGDAGAATTISLSGVGTTLFSSALTTIGHVNATADQSLLISGNAFATINNNLNIINRGVVTVNAGSVLHLDGSLSVTAGGTLTATAGTFSPNVGGATISIGAGGTASLKSQRLTNNQLWTVEGTMNITDTFIVGDDDTLNGGTIRVLSNGLFLANAVSIEGGASDSNFRVSNGGTATSANYVALQSFNSDAVLSVQTGGTFDVNGLLSLENVSGTHQARLDVSGPNSTVNASSLRLGQLTPNSATGTITSGGTLNITNDLTLKPASVLTLDGGTLSFNTFANDGGTFDFISGTVIANTAQNIGNGGAVFGPTLILGVGKKVDINSTLTLQSTGTLHLDGGRLEVNAMTHSGGQLILDSGIFTVNASANVGVGAMLGGELTLKPGLSINATQLVNNGLVHGDGTVNARLLNEGAGEIRVDLAKTARFVTSNPIGHTNNGQIVLNGGRLDLNAMFSNGPAGDITGRGTLVSTLLDNAGDLALSSGISDIHGDVNNLNGARILISGNADVTFWDDLTNNAGATLRVSAGSSATFFGTYSGGSITGTGVVYFEADVTPGFSPAQINIGGDVRFSEASHLFAEIGGTVRGSQYDAIDVGGVATLAGRLSYPLTPGYDPAYGQRHHILHATSIVGVFQPTPVLQLSSLKYFVVLYDADDVFVVAALPGDANVDGAVNFNDLLALAQHYNLSAGQTWQDGDFAGDGAVTFNDLLVLAQHYGQSALQGELIATLPADFASDWVLAQSLVPEPNALLLMGIAGLARRRR